jgi:D-alanyl-D-alanine carboxypeptidase (penicillin-binding protein 5/6)
MIAPARRFVLTLCIALSVVLGLTPALVPAAASARGFTDEAKYAAIVIDANTGEVLYAKRADSPRYPASITKIMTLYLAFEALSTGRLKLTDRLVVSPRAAAQAPSKLGLAAGETISVDEAIRAICTKSANDMAVALAERIGGTEARFAALMTLKAQELGMTNTRFVNANGLPDSRQLSSARDIAILSRAVLRDYPQYYPYFSQRTFWFHGRAINNHNGLLFKAPGVDGIKTGFTNASGFNLAASAVRDGKRLIVVVMGGPTVATRDNHVANLFDIGFDVMRRRARGELITVAQTMFEQSPSPGAPMQYATAQGDISTSPVQVAQPSAPGALRVASVEPAPKASRATRGASKATSKASQSRLKKKEPDATYLVQVGSFPRKAEAHDWLAEVRKRFGTHFAEAEGKVIAGGGRYRTRFDGLTKEAAMAACKALKAKRLACMVIPG